LQCKNTESTKKRNILIVISIVLVTSVFVVFANLRAEYMAQKEIIINPIIFVILNLFLFLITVLISYHFMPSKKEIAENSETERNFEEMEKLKKEIELLKLKKEDNDKGLHERNMQRENLKHYTAYIIERISKKYLDAVQIFISTNTILRTDKKVPVSFSEKIPSLDNK